jgi:hypothetical protein
MGAVDFQIRLRLNPVLTTGALELFLQKEGFVEDDDSFSNRIAGAHYLILDQPEFVDRGRDRCYQRPPAQIRT